MHVLDVGCGMGDVSFLAAELVGPAGTVLGIDHDPVMVDKASQRSRDLDCSSRIRFQQAEAGEFQPEQQFDAVVGRYVLHHLADPTSVLHHVATLVRPGGLLVFHEFDFANPVSMYPETPPLWRQTIDLLAALYRRLGLHADFGLRFTRTFLDAGLPWPTIQAEVPVGGEPGSYLYTWLAETVRTLSPALKQVGLVNENELDVDTLAARLEAESVSRGCQLAGPIQFGAWVRKPT
jgi:SAM-dependent methyltransferase